MSSFINGSTMYQFMPDSVRNMTHYSVWYAMLIAGKEDFSLILVASIVVCVIGIVVLVIVLIVKVRIQKVSSHI
jgi:hypothetical protein